MKSASQIDAALTGEGADFYRIPVITGRPFSFPLDYKSREDIAPGSFLRIPLGRAEITGCVWDDQNAAPFDLRPLGDNKRLPFARLRECGPIFSHVPLLPDSLRHFLDWVAAYYLMKSGPALAGTLRIAEFIEKRGGRPFRNAAGFIPPDPDFAVRALSLAQSRAAEHLKRRVSSQKFSVTLLEGVTGSGKTEVYWEGVAQALRGTKRQALVMLPEIALTAQWIDRVRQRFGCEPLLWHSDLTPAGRAWTWLKVRSGEPCIVVGARSSLFLPFTNLGIIVADEEHEAAYKQEEGFIYNGRDMAIVRARLEGIPAVLVSATPSLETLQNADSGRYHLEQLPHRHGGARMPEQELVDLRAHPPERGDFLSPVLINEIRQVFGRGEQVLLFLNRRGYAPLTLCRHCGFRLQCPHCSAWLVEHRNFRQFRCHHCDYQMRPPTACPECGEEESLTAVGPGAERIEEEAGRHFPNARILSLTSDAMASPRALQRAVDSIASGEVDLIVGTQMVAKGWHFPNLTLVGAVDADLGLGGGDLRAGERTIQLLHQVSGRAGRASAPGRVLLQTYVPFHPVMQGLLKGNFREFMRMEAESRRPGFWPPFGRLAALIVSARDGSEADQIAERLAFCAPQGEGVAVLGPAPAPLALLRGRHRRRLLLRTHRGVPLQPILREWLAKVSLKSGCRVDVDVDPVSFF